MKTKIVLWGENEKEEKILLGIELLESDNLIRINIIPEADATEIFYNQMMNQWREGQHIPMPESTTVIDRPLSMTEGLLPDSIKTQRQDILARAKTEWHFVILSSKLYEAYADEIGQIKERIDDLKEFDSGVWEEMKTFWKKVQNQVQEKNLFREHAAELRTKTNELFDALKSLKRAMNDEFERASKEHLDRFYAKLQDIEERIEKGLGLQPIFNELKGIQQSFKDTQFTRKHHNEVWKRLDGAFKKVKEKKFGKAPAGGNTAMHRLTRRYDGLLSAIEKMEQSINRDTRDKQFQLKRIGSTDGQLEMQIRQAKMAMIEERIASKQTKLDDMIKTRTEIEQKIASEKERAERIEAQKQAAIEAKQAQKTAKENIAKEIEDNTEAMKASENQLQKAAQAIKDAKKIPVTDDVNDKPIAEPAAEDAAPEKSAEASSEKDAVVATIPAEEEVEAPVEATEGSTDSEDIEQSQEAQNEDAKPTSQIEEEDKTVENKEDKADTSDEVTEKKAVEGKEVIEPVEDMAERADEAEMDATVNESSDSDAEEVTIDATEERLPTKESSTSSEEE